MHLVPQGQAEALSYRFWTTGSLSYTDLVLDGFYTPFDADFPEICSPDQVSSQRRGQDFAARAPTLIPHTAACMQFPKLDDLKKVTVAEDDSREASAMRGMGVCVHGPGAGCAERPTEHCLFAHRSFSWTPSRTRSWTS